MIELQPTTLYPSTFTAFVQLTFRAQLERQSMPIHAAENATLRLATPDDIPALLALLLTSFSQFSLFKSLYRPLANDVSTASDTLFFWQRRFQLEFLDPAAKIMVEEVPKNFPASTTRSEGDEVDDLDVLSWRLLRFARDKGLGQDSVKAPGCMIVGFAIWKNRRGCLVKERESIQRGWLDWIKCSFACQREMQL
jgi:hypothetical protein